MSPSTRRVLWDGRGWRHRFAIVATGAIAVFGFAPFHLWGLTLLALTLLFVRLIGVSDGDRPVRTGFGTGLLFGLGWFSASCFWIASAFIERGPEFIPMIPPLVGGLAVLLSLFWGAAAALTTRIMARLDGHGRAGVGGLAFVSTFTVAELLRGHVLSGFPWNLSAYAFEPGGAISQSAYLFGVYGLTMATLIVAALLGGALAMRRLLPALAALGLMGSLFGYGTWRLSTVTVETHPGVVLRIVASPFRQSEKMDPRTSDRVVDDYIRVSLQPGLDTVSHLVWPEGVLSGLAVDDEGLLRLMGRLLRDGTSDTALPPVWLINSQRMEVRPDREGRIRRHYYNSSVAVSFDDAGNPAIMGVNDKKKLVPFAEFIPGGEVVERMGARLLSTALASFTPAPEKRVSTFPGLPPVSPQICYETLFPGLTPAGDTASGQPAPEVILNQSNDAWFGATIGPAQHAAIARYRAIEEGLPLIRSAANGVSGVFDPYGRAERVLDGKRAQAIDELLPLAVGELVAMRWISALLTLCNVGLYFIISLRTRHRF